MPQRRKSNKTNDNENLSSEDDEQFNENQIIDKMKKDLLDDAIIKNKLSEETIFNVLNSYGYSSTSEIEIKNYMNIVNDFKKITGVKE